VQCFLPLFCLFALAVGEVDVEVDDQDGGALRLVEAFDDVYTVININAVVRTLDIRITRT